MSLWDAVIAVSIVWLVLDDLGKLVGALDGKREKRAIMEEEIKEVKTKEMRSWKDETCQFEEVYTALDEVYEECKEPNWDGYGAEPVSEETVQQAKKFFRLVQMPIAVPEVSAGPDGNISLEWYRKDANVIVYVGPKGTSHCISVRNYDIEMSEDGLPNIMYDVLAGWTVA